MLIRLEETEPDKLRADFQQFYNLNLDGMGIDYSYAHAACLAANLPLESRCAKADCEQLQWSTMDYLLARVVDGVEWLCWSKSKKAQKKGAEPPEPMQRPGERSAALRKAEATDKEFVDKILNMNKGAD